MRRLFSRNAKIALAVLPIVAGCALATAGDPPPPILDGEGGEGDTGGTGTGGTGTGGTGTGGTGTGGTGTGGTGTGGTGTGGVSGTSGASSGTAGAATGGSGGTPSTGGSSGAGATGGTAGKGGTAGAGATGGTSGTGATGGTAGKGGTAGSGATGGTGGKGGTAGSASGTGGSGGTTPGGMTLFMDDFEMGSTNWTNIIANSAMWGIATDGSMVYRSTNASQTSTFHGSRAGEISWTNVRVQARVKVNTFAGSASDRYAGICARYRDADNYYCLALRSNDHRVAFRQRVGGSGTNTSASSITFMDNTWYTLRVEAVGGNITAFVNDVQIDAGSRITGATITSGMIALASPGANASFDDVVVTSL